MCTQCPEFSAKKEDCAGRPLNATLIDFVGPNGYLCSNEDRSMPVEIDPIFGCPCANTSVCGKTCEIVSHEECYAENIKRETDICSQMEPGAISTVCLNMQADTGI